MIFSRGFGYVTAIRAVGPIPECIRVDIDVETLVRYRHRDACIGEIDDTGDSGFNWNGIEQEVALLTRVSEVG